MPILFTCPHCNAETVVDEAFLGQSGPCAICGRVVTVPGDATGAQTTLAQRVSKAGLNLNNLTLLVGVIAVSLAACVAIIGIGVSLIVPAVKIAQAANHKAQSEDNLRQILVAMDQYHAAYGSYPPAYVTDKSGKKMHSWRVLLLPYLNAKGTYDQYRMDLPWDDPHNARLEHQMPAVYASPGDTNALTSYETSYLVIVGPRTMFPDNKTMNVDNVKDLRANTILVVESTESGINWMEPKDLDAKTMDYTINGGQKDCIRSHHPGGAHVGFVSGATLFLDDHLNHETVEALTTPNGKDDAAVHLP